MSPYTTTLSTGSTVRISDPQFVVQFDQSLPPYRLTKPLTLELFARGEDSPAYRLLIPGGDAGFGFEFDGASVPRLLWWFMSPMERAVIVAACVHDYLYRIQLFARYLADDIFYSLLRMFGVCKARAWAAWKAVSRFGHRAWNQNAKKLKLEARP